MGSSSRPKPKARPSAGRRERSARPSRPLSEGAFALAFASLCSLLALAFFREFVLRGGTMPFGTDMLEEAYPLRNFAVEELRAGRPFPLWNPYAYSGIPFLETLPYPVYYPTTLLYFLIPLGRAIGWTFVLHFALAGALTSAWARRLGVSRPGAALAGLAFMFNGYLVSHLYAGQDGRMFAMTLIPLVFFFLRAGLDTRRLGPYLLMGGAVALQIFTPHVQIMYFSSLAASAYFLRESAGRWRREGPRPALADAARFAAGFALAAAVGAVELWPTGRFLEWAVRGAESGYAYASSWAVPPSEVSAIVMPDLFGSLATYWGSNPFKLHTEYLGAVPLALALAAVVWGDRRRTLFWAAAFLVALLFATGAATPVHRLAYWVLPMVKSFRAPGMMMGVAAFAVATLAGLGFDAAAGRAGARPPGARPAAAPETGDRGSLVFLGAAVLVALAWLLALASPGSLAGMFGGTEADLPPRLAAARDAALAALPGSFTVTALAWLATVAVAWWGLRRGRLAPAAAAGLLAVVLVADLWRIDARYLEVVEIDEAFAPRPADRFLADQEPPFRILPLPGSMGPNEPILRRLEALWGLQKFRLGWYDELMGGASVSNLGRVPLWRVLNLRYLTSVQPLELAGVERVFEGEPGVYRWNGEAPRAWVVSRSRVADDDEAIALLSDPAFDAHAIVLLPEAAAPLDGGTDLPPAGEEALPSSPEAGAEPGAAPSRAPADESGAASPGTPGTEPDAARSGTVRYLEHTPNHIAAEVTSAAPGFAVFSEAYHPYWEATVDGQPAPVLRADVAFRAVRVPAGTHRVEMEYQPRAYRQGRVVSLIGLAAGLAYAAAAGWRARGRLRGWRGT